MENFVGTFWAFVPAIIAIALALVTKQVYLSLFLGIFVGSMFLAGGNPVEAIANMFGTMGSQLGSNGGILIFLVVLGIFAVLLVKTGGSKAYGDWASTSIKSRKGALLSTIGLGSLIFVDDYFNCLTVGSVMRPVTDKHGISRAKLAYLIDSTAAPICIIAPISSWAAAVSGFIDGDGIIVFIKTIPLNMYALLTIAMMIIFVVLKLDLFKMKKNEKAAQKGDLTAGENELPTEDITVGENVKGKIWYLVVPIVILIVCCVGAMIYSGYFYDWDAGVYGTTVQSDSFISAFSNCDSGSALAMGSVIALIISFIVLVAGKAISFKECMASIPEGFKSMVPAILILCFAWTLCATMGAKGAGLDEVTGNVIMDGTLNAKAFILKNISADNMALGIVPAVFFLIACLISFATGTSWGTFGVLIPIAISVMGGSSEGLLFLTMSAVLAGAVYGDHVSPISDTTIMASSGAQCNHVDHVRTQFPYATIVAGVSFVSYIITGFIAQSGASYGLTAGITLPIGLGLLGITIAAFYFLDKYGVLEKLAAKLKKKKA